MSLMLKRYADYRGESLLNSKKHKQHENANHKLKGYLRGKPPNGGLLMGQSGSFIVHCIKKANGLPGSLGRGLQVRMGVQCGKGTQGHAPNVGASVSFS